MGLFNFSFKASPGGTQRPLAILGRGYRACFWAWAPRLTDQFRLVGPLVRQKLFARSVEHGSEDLTWNFNAVCVNNTPSGTLKVTLKPFEEAFEDLNWNLNAGCV